MLEFTSEDIWGGIYFFFFNNKFNFIFHLILILISCVCQICSFFPSCSIYWHNLLIIFYCSFGVCRNYSDITSFAPVSRDWFLFFFLSMVLLVLSTFFFILQRTNFWLYFLHCLCYLLFSVLFKFFYLLWIYSFRLFLDL